MAMTPTDSPPIHESFNIFECIPPWIVWQQDQRSCPCFTEAIKAGINFSIILASACYVEGRLEHILTKRINDTSESGDELHQRLINDLRERISRTMGSDGYNGIFGLVIGNKASDILGNQATWETITTLFHFRNVIAHGRAVGYKLFFPPGGGGMWREEFSGGYKKVEDFLLKKNLIQTRHIEEASNWHYFSDEVADYFWSEASSFINQLNEAMVTTSPKKG